MFLVRCSIDQRPPNPGHCCCVDCTRKLVLAAAPLARSWSVPTLCTFTCPGAFTSSCVICVCLQERTVPPSWRKVQDGQSHDKFPVWRSTRTRYQELAREADSIAITNR